MLANQASAEEPGRTGQLVGRDVKSHTDEESWIYVHEPKSKQQGTVRVFQNEPMPPKVVRERST